MNDGPQSNFKFAQLTVSDAGVFRGRVLLNAATGPEAFPFEIPFLPEPSRAALAGMAFVSMLGIRRAARRS